MKLYMKQKVFSWADKFTVKDANGQDRYVVEGELFSWGKKLHIYNMLETEVAFIQQKVFSWMPRFQVFMAGRQMAEIVKEFTFFRPKYQIQGPDWEADGSFWEHDYEITSRGRRIVAIHKAWMSWGDSYELDVERPEDAVLALAVVLAIDCVQEAQAASNAN